MCDESEKLKRKRALAAAAQRRYYERNRSKIAADRKEKNAAAPDKARQRARDWYSENLDRARDVRTRYRLDDPERKKSQDKAYYEANKETVIKRASDWAGQNADRVRECRRAAYRRDIVRKRRQKVEQVARRRARKLAAPGTHTRAQLEELWEANGKRCAYCTMPVTVDALTADHIVPLSKGGSDGIENIAPACLPCNQRKHVRSADEFRAMLAKA